MSGTAVRRGPVIRPGEPASAGGRGGLSQGFRRLHPITPWRRVWAVLAGIAAVVLHDPEQAARWSGHLATGWLVIGLVVLIPGAFAYGFVSWWFTRYRIDATELRVDTGAVFRRTKHFRIDRLQAVDITRPLVGRIMGVAKLQLDLAGGKDQLAYLTERDARALRAELLARAAGVSPESGEAPEDELVRVPSRAIVIATLLQLPTWGSVGASLILVVLLPLLTGNLLSLFIALPVLIAAGHATFGRYAKEFGWTIAESPDGLRIDHGLLDRAHETVPPGRVQALSFLQPLLWRRRDWMSLHMTVPGGSTGLLLPVAPRDVAMGTAARIWPGAELEAVAMGRAPRRAFWRAPLRSRTLACGSGHEVFVARDGLLRRRTLVVPHAKVQSVRLTQGPWERMLRLASVHLDVAAGASVTAAHRDVREAGRIVAAQAERSRVGRRNAPPERWMTAPARPGPVTSDPMGHDPSRQDPTRDDLSQQDPAKRVSAQRDQAQRALAQQDLALVAPERPVLGQPVLGPAAQGRAAPARTDAVVSDGARIDAVVTDGAGSAGAGSAEVVGVDGEPDPDALP